MQSRALRLKTPQSPSHLVFLCAGRKGTVRTWCLLKEYGQRKMGKGGLPYHHAPPHTSARSTSCGGLKSTTSLRSLRLQEDHPGWEATAIFPFLCYYATHLVEVPEDAARYGLSNRWACLVYNDAFTVGDSEE